MRAVAFEIEGRPYHALAAGEEGRPLLLLLHGFPEYSGAWAEVMPLLSRDFFCVAPDQRGYGRSWRPEGVEHYAMRHLVADAEAMIERFGAGRAAAVVGHDWGASIAYALALRAPRRLARLIVLNGVHPLAFQEALAAGGAQAQASQYIHWLRAEGSERALAEHGFARLMTIFGAGMDVSWLTPERSLAYVRAWGDEAGLRAMIDWYRASSIVVPQPGEPLPAAALPAWDPARFRVTMPHLVIWGMGDTALLPELRLGAAPYCDAFEIEEVHGADHWIIHQAPDLVAERIARFLAGGP